MNVSLTGDAVMMQCLYVCVCVCLEPMFGSSLADVCTKDNNNVPLFLVSCFRMIEEQGNDE